VSWTDLRRRILRLRALGYRIALGGVGLTKPAGLWQLRPEFLTLDAGLVRGLDRSPGQRAGIRSLVGMCGGELAIQVVVPGVTTSAEREALAAEGCDLMRGPLFRSGGPV